MDSRVTENTHSASTTTSSNGFPDASNIGTAGAEAVAGQIAFPAPDWLTGGPAQAQTQPGPSRATDWLTRIDGPDPMPSLTSLGTPKSTQLLSPDTLIEDPVGLAAEAVFATAATKAALNNALGEIRQSAALPSRPSDPSPPSEWAPHVEQNGEVIHAFLGVTDPLAPPPAPLQQPPPAMSAASSFDEDDIEADLRAAVADLNGADLESGELAALDAFDDALERGADMHEALSAAITAAEAAGGPDWNKPREGTPGLPVETAGEPGRRRQPGRQDQLDAEEDGSERRPSGFSDSADAPGTNAARPLFNVIIGERLGTGVFGLNPSQPDAAFGLGFTFGSDPRTTAARDDERNDVVTTASAAATTTASVIGSTGNDFLVGGSGNDAVGGRGGGDYLYGDTPDNYDSAVHDAASPLTNPTFSGGSNDFMSGGAGADSLWGGGGDDQLHGDIPDSSSTLYAEFGFDLGSAGFGDDALWGGDGADTLYGGDGDDALYGEAGNDSLVGGAGDDSLTGGDGADSLDGGDGIDNLYGNAGADNIFGYAGDDVMIGGEGDDSLTGGAGADEARFTGGTGADALAKAQSLGTDTINDYSASDGDTFGISDADFGLGSSGNLTDGTNYFEQTAFTLSETGVDVSGGQANAGIVILGQNTGTDGAAVYYTTDASDMSNANSYQIADVIGVNMSDLEAADFFLRS